MLYLISNISKEDSLDSKVSELVALEGLRFLKCIRSLEHRQKPFFPNSNLPSLHKVLGSKRFIHQVLLKIELVFVHNLFKLLSSRLLQLPKEIHKEERCSH
jgi:hypothetical protein